MISSTLFAGVETPLVLDIYMSDNPIDPDELSIWPTGNSTTYELQSKNCGRTSPFEAERHDVAKIWSLQIFADQGYRLTFYCNNVKVHSWNLNCEKWTSSNINAIKVSRQDKAADEYRFKDGKNLNFWCLIVAFLIA